VQILSSQILHADSIQITLWETNIEEKNAAMLDYHRDTVLIRNRWYFNCKYKLMFDKVLILTENVI
jgi:hypothetical protein